MASHRLPQLQQQFLFVFGQVHGERQRIGGMVGAEDNRLRRVEAADQFQYRQVVRHLEWLAVCALERFHSSKDSLMNKPGDAGHFIESIARLPLVALLR